MIVVPKYIIFINCSKKSCIKSSKSKNKSLAGSIKCLGKQSEIDEEELKSVDFLQTEVIKMIKIDFFNKTTNKNNLFIFIFSSKIGTIFRHWLY